MSAPKNPASPRDIPDQPASRGRMLPAKKKAGMRPKIDPERPAPRIDRDALLAGAWINRDLAWLEFNRRVLNEALDARTPLLERVKFLVWKALTKSLLRNRIAYISVVLMLTVFFGYQATKVELSYNFAKILPPDDSSFVAYQEFKKNFEVE